MKSNKNINKASTSKKVALYFTLVLAIALVVLIFAATNIFTENPFQKKNFILFFLMIFCIFSGITIWNNYKKDERKKLENNSKK